MAVQTSQSHASRAPHAWAGLRPPPRSGRALPLAVALRDRRWLTLHRQHSTSPFAHTRAHDIRSARAHKHTCTLTRRSLSSRHSVTQRGHAWMDAHAPHRHAAGWRQVSRTLKSNPFSLHSCELATPFLLPFFSNFQVSSKSCVTLFFRRLRASPRRHDEPTSASGAIEALALEWMRHLINVVTPALLRLPSAWRSNLGNFLHRVASPASPVCVTRCVQLAQTRNS